MDTSTVVDMRNKRDNYIIVIDGGVILVYN